MQALFCWRMRAWIDGVERDRRSRTLSFLAEDWRQAFVEVKYKVRF